MSDRTLNSVGGKSLRMSLCFHVDDTQILNSDQVHLETTNQSLPYIVI